jgi:hypothetical protein
MAIEESRTVEDIPRKRAWVLLNVDSEKAEETAEALQKNLGLIGDDLWVVVRADVVAGLGNPSLDYNIVVPVDAQQGPDGGPEEKHLLDAIATIKAEVEAVVGDNYQIAVLNVTKHNPDPPHASHSYVTKPESDKVPDHSVEVGRRKFASPAENAWG